TLVHRLLSFFFFSSRRRHTRFSRDWSSDVCSSDLSHLGKTNREAVGVLAACGGEDFNSCSGAWAFGGPFRHRSPSQLGFHHTNRSEERRVRKECGSPCSSVSREKKVHERRSEHDWE